MKKEYWIDYKACIILPSCSTFVIESYSRVEKMDELITSISNLFYLVINNIKYNDKKVAILNTKLLDMMQTIQKVKFNENLYQEIGKFLLESKKFHVIDENGLVWK